MKLESILGKPENKRAIRGYAILAKGDEPKQIKENVFRVPSQNSEKYYYVTNKRMENGTAPAQTTNTGKLCVNISMQ